MDRGRGMIEKMLFVPSEYIYKTTTEGGEELSPAYALIPDAVNYDTMWVRAYTSPDEQTIIDRLEELSVEGYLLLNQEEAIAKCKELRPQEDI